MLLNSLIGNFGKYQLWICFMIFASKFGVALHLMAIIFLAPPVHYTCPIRNNNTSSCCDNPIYNTSMFSRTTVTEWNLICDKSWLKDFTQTLFQFGVLIGSLLFGIASDRYGRRPALLSSVVLEVFAGIMVTFMPDYWSFTIIRMVLGLAVGGIMVVGFVLLMEYVGLKYRDLISTLFHVPFTIGHMFLALFGYYIRDYVHLQLSISLVNVILLLYICILPESPRWLLATLRTFKAVKLIEHVAAINDLPVINIQQEIELFQISSTKNGQSRGSIIDLFYYPNLRRNIMVMSFIWFADSYCYYGVSQYISHLGGDIFVNVAASGIVCLCGCVLVLPLIKFMYRRTLVITLNVICSIFLISVIFVPEGTESIVMGCFSVLFSYMALIVVYLYCSEMFPTIVRNAAVGVSSMMARFGAMIAPFVASLRPHGKWCAPVAFGILPLVAALLCLMLPETKGCDLLMTIQQGEDLGRKKQRQVQTSTSAEATSK